MGMPPAAPLQPHRRRAVGLAARLLALPLLGGFGVRAVAATPAAASASSPQPPVLDDEQVRRWFARIHVAARELNYQGTLVSSADGVLSSARVAHFTEGGESYERVEVLDGRMQRTYRHDDQVTTLWPAKRVAVIERRDPRATALRTVLDPRARGSYRVQEQGPAMVAGREAVVLLLRPQDELRFTQRLWVDAGTALVLRTDVLGPQQQVLESSAFSEVQIGVRPQPQTVLQPMRRLDGWHQVRPQPTVTRLEAEGWALRAPVPGFELTGCARRLLDPADGADGAAVLQAVFSDGLTHVSLFIEPRGSHGHRAPIQGHSGATYTLMQPHGDAWWVTAVGDVPPAALQQFVQALQRRP